MNTSGPQSPKIGIPEPRLEQLRALSDALGGKTMSATIGQLLEWAREQGKIKDHSIPGIDVRVFKDGMAITLDDGKMIGFTPEMAAKLSSSIGTMATGTEGESVVVNMDGNWMLDRRGKHSIKIAIPMTAAPKFFATDLALEFAALIDRFLADAPDAETAWNAKAGAMPSPRPS